MEFQVPYALRTNPLAVRIRSHYCNVTHRRSNRLLLSARLRTHGDIDSCPGKDLIMTILSFVHVPARLSLIAQALPLLRNQPASALTAVDWTLIGRNMFPILILLDRFLAVSGSSCTLLLHFLAQAASIPVAEIFLTLARDGPMSILCVFFRALPNSPLFDLCLLGIQFSHD